MPDLRVIALFTFKQQLNRWVIRTTKHVDCVGWWYTGALREEA